MSAVEERAAEPESRDFRIRSRRIMLTYKTHIPKDQLEIVLRALRADFVRIAHENADASHPYEHTHAVIAKPTGKIWATTKARYFDFGDIHPNIKSIRTELHWKNELNYITKEDPANADLKKEEKESICERIWSKETMQDALRTCTAYSQIMPTIAAYAHRPIDQPEFPDPEEWRPWQQIVLRIIESPPDDRTILWISDPAGGGGKSFLAKWLAINRGALVVSHFGRMADIMTLCSNSLESGCWNGKIFIADLARDAQDKAIYEPLEAIKNGHIQTTKYVGKVRWIESPHVIVLANFYPDKTKMTKDRWQIINLPEDKPEEQARGLTLEGPAPPKEPKGKEPAE